MFRSINPYTKEEIGNYKLHSKAELHSIINSSHNAFNEWKARSFAERSAYFKKLSSLLRDKKEALALLITSEMGKIIGESRAEIEKCAWLCDYYAEDTEILLSTEHIATEASESFVSYEPSGIIYGIMPWNFPFWQVMRACVPNIMAGNTFILKHAPNVMGCATEIEKLFKEAGFPDFVFSNIIIDIDLSEDVVSHPFISGVSLTGSQQAGQAVAMQAGKHLKKSVMELGGSDPYIVLKDAKINDACKTALCSRMLNAGQVCISAKRFIIDKSIAENFIKEQINLLDSYVLGDPMDEKTDMGPMARPDLLEKIEQQVKDSISLGAKLLYGGKRKGDNFYEPTLITNVGKGMPLYDEESFGPVAVIIEVDGHEEAMEVANDTIFGLGASIWTEDADIAKEMAKKINAGAVFINGMTKSDPRLSFGGIKQSGYGRELGSLGIREFLNAKTVWIK